MIFIFGSSSDPLYSVNLIADMPETLEHFTDDHCTCFFIPHVPCNWKTTAVHKLPAERAVSKQLHDFCNNTGNGKSLPWWRILTVVPERWYQTVRNQIMLLILSCSINGPGALGASRGSIVSKVPLATRQFCRVSTIHIHTIRQQCNVPPQNTVSTFQSLPSFLLHTEFRMSSSARARCASWQVQLW